MRRDAGRVRRRLTAYLRREGGSGLRLTLRQGEQPEGREERAARYDFGHLEVILDVADAEYWGRR